MSATPWLDEMVSLVGLREIRGKKHEGQILEFFKDCGHDEIDDDETAWCAAAAGSCLVKTKRPPSMPVESNLLARSYLRYGTKLAKPVKGALAIWPRGKSKTYGHINFVEEVHEDGSITCVGGNQSDKTGKSDGMVSRVTYSADQVKGALGFRWPPEPKTIIGVTKTAVKSKRFMGTVVSFILLVGGAIMDGLHYLIDGIGHLIDILPGVTGEASSVIASNQQIFEWLGIPWGKLSLGMTAGVLLYVGGRHLFQKINGEPA